MSSFGVNVPSPVDLKVGSDGSLYYLSIGDGAVYRVSFASTITPTPTATPAAGSPQTVTSDDIPAFNTNKPLQFEYPTGVISWIEGQWWLNGPSGLFTTQSASLQSGVTSGSDPAHTLAPVTTAASCKTWTRPKRDCACYKQCPCNQRPS